MKIKTSELKDVTLDWAVTVCEGKAQGHPPLGERRDLAEGITPYGVKVAMYYSSAWVQGGPIIEREKIAIKENGYGHWFAKVGASKWMRGSTPLIAAMRCYVASKLSDEVDVPEELCQPTV